MAEINSQGGYVRQYQALVDPARLRHYGLSVQQVVDAIAANNSNASGGVLPLATEQYLIQGVGLIRTLEDIGNIVVKEERGTPVFVRDLAEVRLGHESRHGAIVKGGVTESVAGIVMMTRGGNAKEVVGRVKTRVAEINAKGMLPGGLQIVPFYDRTDLVDAALWTVGKVLIEGAILVVLVLFVFLGDVRSSLIVVATLIITPLATFIVMNRWGISANLMSLGGLAIAIGLMVDGTVVVVENVFHKLGQLQDTGRASRLRTIVQATGEVATPTVFGILVIVLVFLPLMALQGIEGKMFAPLALAIVISLLVSLAVSLVLSPVLCSYFLKGGDDHDTWLHRLPQAPLPVAARRRAGAPPGHAGGGGGAAARLAGAVPVPRQVVHADHEGGRTDAADQPRAEHLARRVDPHGDGGDEHGGGRAGRASRWSPSSAAASRRPTRRGRTSPTRSCCSTPTATARRTRSTRTSASACRPFPACRSCCRSPSPSASTRWSPACARRWR